MSTLELIDIEETSKEKTLILTGTDIPYSILIVHTMFVPSNVTRVEYQLVSDQSIFVSPEHQMHFEYLLKQREIDEDNFLVPTSRYHPNYLEQLFMPKQGGSVLLLETGSSNPDFKSNPTLSKSFSGSLLSLEE